MFFLITWQLYGHVMGRGGSKQWIEVTCKSDSERVFTPLTWILGHKVMKYNVYMFLKAQTSMANLLSFLWGKCDLLLADSYCDFNSQVNIVLKLIMTNKNWCSKKLNMKTLHHGNTGSPCTVFTISLWKIFFCER